MQNIIFFISLNLEKALPLSKKIVKKVLTYISNTHKFKLLIEENRIELTEELKLHCK